MLRGLAFVNGHITKVRIGCNQLIFRKETGLKEHTTLIYLLFHVNSVKKSLIKGFVNIQYQPN